MELELLHRFLAQGADINVRNQAGETPIFAFFRHGQVVAELDQRHVLVEDDGNDLWRSKTWKAIIQREGAAAVNKEYLVWQVFDDAGVDWTATSHRGETLLHVVASDTRPENMGNRDLSGRRVKRFEFLMGKGLDPMMEDKAHRTSLGE
jgi:hypothetical protein